MIKIPQNGKWVQTNKSDVFGSLSTSFNLDLTSNEGITRVSPRTKISTDDITDLGVPVAFNVFTDQNGSVQYAWAVAGGYVFRMNVNTAGFITAFAKDGSAGSPSNVCSSDVSDMAYYGKLWQIVTSTDDVYRYNASNGQWNDGANEIGSGTHMLCTYGTRFYVTGANTKIYSFTPANYAAITLSSSYTLDLANGGYPVTSISTIRSVSDGIWVFTINQSESGCWAFKWDGVTATDPNTKYIIPDASGVLAAIIKDDTPWIIDNNARLMYCNGGTFVPAPNGKLPVKNAKFLKNPLSASNDRWIHPNGIDIVDGKIRILVNNEQFDNTTTIDERFPSGVWEYSTETGWIHITSLSLYTSSVTDYGQNRVSRVGALYAHKTETTAASANGTMLIGAQLYSDASTTKEVILFDDSNDTLQKYGYFVTSKIFSENITDTWEKIYVRNKKLLDSADVITLKYRTNDVEATEATITWTSTTTFTTTADLAAYEIGDEVEVLQGKGGGKCAHISAITHAGTTSVTVDEVFTGASSGTAKARFQHWVKIGSFTSQTEKYFSGVVGVNDTWIQIKVCMQFTGKDELHDITLINGQHKPAS